ncbi:prolidase [Histoplasma capsulatum G186AR]|uniref:Probable Xaa-Pro aminopeptidase PEPP n=2 Tax=Ajellomyces capsulatus TaxID=5037 RepID=AMPP3_AJECG|nr:prolidase [Histoplasma capsulatum G186AR]C0NIF0.1 RecName: Full=Probable Xaa-Pro aminopeptidase PEPP; AltName: Full=Aminoacylproline aminopeptidase; AltName: Full=Prolidase [Histoplasma capsulatum G186AR]EEH08670.1 prolidase [Histoplasma capsulatum G186AR]KAG5304019.1 prolidase [Histoplasma capsulatum]QSS69618.1 prolidase [Histoplasma capsulatum G186AR]
MDESVDRVLAGKYPAKAHAKRVAARIRELGYGESGVIYLEGQKTQMIEDNDGSMPFRQRRNFFYLSGCPLPDSYLTYNIEEDHLTLFIPPIDEDSVIWSGLPLSPDEALEMYDVDAVLLTTDVNTSLAHFCSVKKGKKVFAIADQVSPHITFLPFQETDFDVLKRAAEESRVVKDTYEIALLRRANEISTKAHVAVIKAARSAANERELEAIFIATCMSYGCREQSYHPIFASGTNAATLHYQNNNEDLVDKTTGEKRLNMLVDAGGEYRTYCADITRVVPLSGKFSAESRQIYDIVLDMQMTSLAMIRAGVMWEDVHSNSHRVAIRGLLKLGILRGTEEELFDKGISVAFFPHGVGHYLGMDTHDTGGNPNYKDENPKFKYLRLRGTLACGAVVTVEPGIYFCRFIIDPYLASPELGKYIDTNVLERYWNVGGVRIEDNVVVTQNGHDNLTAAPKIPEEIEKLVAAAQ